MFCICPVGWDYVKEKSDDTECRYKGELEAILEPSVPRWNYGGFLTGPYHVPEEEAIFWSKASLEAPLNDEGARRYRDVAAVAFPEEMAEIWGTDDTGEGGIAV